MVKKFVLRCDWFAKKLKELSNNDRYTSSRDTPALQNEVQLVKGTMVEEMRGKHGSLNPPYNGMLNVKSLDHDDLYVTCPECVLVEVELFHAELLLAITPFRERWNVLEDKQWLKEASLLIVGALVNVRIKEDKDPAHGVIRFVGLVPEMGNGKGFMFGVELQEHYEWGFTDGSLNGHVYFYARIRNGVFVPLNRIRLQHDKKPIITSQPIESKSGVSAPTENSGLGPLVPIQRSQFTSPQPSSRPLPVTFDQALAEGASRPPLQLRDRVVWISDTGPEYGVVKWLGKLPDVGDDWMVGVEFDNAVGSGTGRYQEQQLFEAELNHASLVPIIGLMKAEDFQGGKNSSTGIPSNSTPPRPHRTKKTPEVFRETSVPRTTQQTTFSSLPRDSTRKLETDNSRVQLDSCCGEPYSGTPTSRYSQSVSSNSHTWSGSLGSRLDPPPLYSSVDKSRSSHKVPNGVHYERASPPVMDLLGDPFSTNSNQPQQSTLRPRPSVPCPLDDCLDKGRGRMLNEGFLIDVGDQSFYHVMPEDCTPPPLRSSSRSVTSSVNPLYEASNRKSTGSSTGKLGTTRLDDTTDCGSLHRLYGLPNHTLTSHTVGPLKKVHNNLNNNNHIIMNNSGGDTMNSSLEMEVGSLVEVSVNSVPCYGVIRWIGTIPEEANGGKLVAGIEMEDESASCTDGTFHGHRYFQCQPRKALFVRLSQCRKDARFLDSEKRKSAVFGSIDCPSVTGDVPPLSNPEQIRLLHGKNRGIQGHHNSCYLDATLFAMFSCTSVFDCLLHRPANSKDISEYEDVQRVLKEEVVNPLRAQFYVRADRVLRLRKLLDRLSSVSGLMTEEKDPEEFLNSLLNQILKADPFLKLSSGQEAYFYQLFVEKDEKLALPTVQQLFDQSFLTSDIKLREIPPCLLIQMPRFGKQFKMYPRIVPSLYLDITDVLDDSPRQCSVCGQVAEFECKECFGQLGPGLDSTAFCHPCMEKSHSHKKRCKHQCTRLKVPQEFKILQHHTAAIPRIYMELFAVLCIETSHYVSFVKCGSGPDAPWCFFDSMADRKGEQNGYNIPEVSSFEDLRWWLSDEGTEFLMTTKEDKMLPEIARRLLCDAYMCMYQSPEVMMYR